jgi:hypothetical protein
LDPDGGALRLTSGTTLSVSALAREKGGTVIVNDAEGEACASLPPMNGLDDLDADEEEE